MLLVSYFNLSERSLKKFIFFRIILSFATVFKCRIEIIKIYNLTYFIFISLLNFKVILLKHRNVTDDYQAVIGTF